MDTNMNGRVQLIGQPGQPAAIGGMADVYRARWISHNNREYLAVKVIRASQLEDQRISARNAQRLQRELDVWSRLTHANVLPFYGTCEDVIPGRVALVSPWMDYGNLPSYIARNPTAPRWRLVDDIMSGLDYLHSKNVVHGDIKGNNVLIGSGGRAVLSDFGRAFIMDEIEASKSLSAAAHWTAPEVLITEDSIPLTKMSDVWSLGVTMFEIYVGMERLWGGTRRVANVIRKLSEGKTPDIGGPAQYNEVPEYLWDILYRCWHFVPEARPAVHIALREYRSRTA